jgi:hypothetical protein
MSTWQKVGSCPICGAPIYASKEQDSETPPKVCPSCDCRKVAQSLQFFKGLQDANLDLGQVAKFTKILQEKKSNGENN